MSKPISNAQLKKNLTGKVDRIDTMLRALPFMIQNEVENPNPNGNSPKVIKNLRKQFDMITKLKMETV